MPLLTHEETGTESVARNRAVALAERPPPPSVRPRPEGGGRPAGRPAPARRTPRQRILRILYVLLGLALLGPFLAFALGWMLFRVPTAEDAPLEQVARFTYSGGEEFAAIRPENADGDVVNRTVVRLDQVPLVVQDAVLAAENKDFRTDPGFDITGIARAVYNQLTGGVGGGSTITQQYIKVTTGEDDFSLIRKYKEVVLAVKITREQTKDEILEGYLNVIYFGRGAYGIQAASQAYFGKDVGQLTVSEAAMLAGAIQAPSRWDPAKDLEGSQRRWEYVLEQMVGAGTLTPEERAAQVFPTWQEAAPASSGLPADSLGHVVSQVRDELGTLGISPEQLSTEGLTVETTIDPERQREAIEAATEQLDGQPENLRTALISIDPRSGAVQAYYGGANGQGTDYAQSPNLPPGSTFKPFVLAAALQADPEIGLGTEYDGASGQELAGTVVRNSEGFDCDRCSLKTAMTRSINTVFYQLGLDVGLQRVIDTAHALGVPEQYATEARGGITLGDQAVPPVHMAAAFATLAADGVRHDPHFIRRVTAADGRVLFERTPPQGTQAVPAQVARNVTEAMIDIPEFAGRGLSGGRPVAGKSGTNQRGEDGQNRDAWFVGYTPQLATAVWIGTDQGEAIEDAQGRAVYGRMIPGGIWQQYMNAALQGEDVERFSPFEPLGRAPFDEDVDEDGNEDDDGGDDEGRDDGDDDGGDGNDDGDGGDGDRNDFLEDFFGGDDDDGNDGGDGDGGDGGGDGNDGDGGNGGDGNDGDRGDGDRGRDRGDDEDDEE
jgi:membrane peptidoglycan carboxypeptidase